MRSPLPTASRPPGVMQIALALDPGGTERMIIELTRGVRQHHDVCVLCLDHPGAWARELTDIGVEVVSLRRQPGFRPGLGRRIAAEARRRGVRILHCHHYSPYVYGCLAWLSSTSLHIVMTEHGRLSDAAPSLKRRLITPLLTRVPGPIFAVSDDLRDYMITAGFPERRVGVIHNGIAMKPAPDDAARTGARQTLGLAADTPVIGFVGRLDPVKDLRTLLSAFRLVCDHISHAKLVIVGEGPERPDVEAHIQSLRLEGSVLLTGVRNDVRQILPALDVMVNSSTSEGISVTLLEAMAAQLPIVATAVGGTPEVVVDGTTGSLVAPRDSSALGFAAIRMLRTPEMRESYGIAGRRRFEQEFTADRMVEQYLQVYSRILTCAE